MTCGGCGRAATLLEKMNAPIGAAWVCPSCQEKQSAEKERQKTALHKKANAVILTTTPSVDGYRVSAYLGIESVEIVIGTGLLSELTGEISDFLGQRSSRFEGKLQEAKRAAFQILRIRAAENGAHAVIGIDLDYTEFSGNRIGLILNGTMVRLAQADASSPPPL
jgi:uncharacterized protein YbjQ (UPF0145 family)